MVGMPFVDPAAPPPDGSAVAPELGPDAAADLLQRVPGLRSGLVPVVAQQWDSGEVLMLAWADAEAVRRTFATGRATYYSRSRASYWAKGETSGHVQRVVAVAVDCDGDALLYRVDQQGPACHTGTRTCWTGRELWTSAAHEEVR
jgi:phosphoribosyl-AMP cyclohydrolase